jgi:hypothetical protein
LNVTLFCFNTALFLFTSECKSRDIVVSIKGDFLSQNHPV